MLFETTIDGVDIILNGHIHADQDPNTISVGGRYVTRAELDEVYPRYISEHYFGENLPDKFKDWSALDIDAKMVIFNIMTLEWWSLNHYRVKGAFPRMMKD